MKQVLLKDAVPTKDLPLIKNNKELLGASQRFVLILRRPKNWRKISYTQHYSLIVRLQISNYELNNSQTFADKINVPDPSPNVNNTV